MAKTGIYRIVHIATGMTYVGQSNNITDRLSTHRLLLQSDTHHCGALQNMWNQHGGVGFAFEEVETATCSAGSYELQQWLLDKERSYFRQLTDRGLCLNSHYPVLVHAKNSQTEMLQQNKEEHRNIATLAEDERKLLTPKLEKLRQRLSACQEKINSHSTIINQTTGFFAFILGRSNPEVAKQSRAALQPLYEERQQLQREFDQLSSKISELEQTRRKNNSAARRMGSKQREIKSRKQK